MDDDPRRMSVMDCVLGVGTRSFRCCNGNISFYYSDNVAVSMMVLDIGYKEFRAQRNLFPVRVDVSPITQVSNIVAVMDPLLDSLAIVIPFDEVIFATEVPDSGLSADRPACILSRFPGYVVLIASETTSDLLMEGLARVDIFGVNCNPVMIGPSYPQPQLQLLGYPPVSFGCLIENPDDLMIILQECCPRHRQQQLERMMENPALCTEMVLEVIYDAMFPKEPDGELY